MTTFFPEIRLEVAFAYEVAAAGSFILNTSLLDTGTLASDYFVDTSQWVEKVSTQRGVSRHDGVYARAQAGRATVVFDNSDRRFDPTNLAGPYVQAGRTEIVPMRAFRLQATWAGVAYELWRGFADEWRLDYSGGDVANTTLTGTDGTKVVSNYDSVAGATVGAGETTGARINRILDNAGWPAAERVIDTGLTTVQSTDLANNAWTEILLTADTEIGEVYFDATNRVVFRNRHAVINETRSATPQAVFGCGGAALTLPGTAGNYASTPDSVANSITGDLDLRAKIAPTDWTPTAESAVIGKWVFASKSYLLTLAGTSGVLRLYYSPDGTTSYTHDSSAAVPFADGQAGWIRAAHDVDNGAAGRTTTFYTSTDGVTWTQLGTPQTTAGVIGLVNGTSALGVGAFDNGGGGPLAGVVGYAEVRNGIGGPVVAKFDPSTMTPVGVRNPTTLVASTGETWTVNGSAWDWQAALPSGELGYDSVDVVNDDTQVRNIIRISRVGGTVQTVQDAGSIAEYQRKTWGRSDLIMQTDTEAADYAAYVLSFSKDAPLRFDSIRVTPTTDPDRLWPQVLGRELGDRITVKFAPPGGGTVIQRDAFIRGIKHDVVGSGAWVTVWSLQDADAQLSFMVLDHASLGVLDANSLAF